MEAIKYDATDSIDLSNKRDDEVRGANLAPSENKRRGYVRRRSRSFNDFMNLTKIVKESKDVKKKVPTDDLSLHKIHVDARGREISYIEHSTDIIKFEVSAASMTDDDKNINMVPSRGLSSHKISKYAITDLDIVRNSSEDGNMYLANIFNNKVTLSLT